MATNRPKLKFLRGSTYTFDVSAAALATHPFKFTADSGSTEYTTGVTLTGTQGQAGASLSITVSDSAPFNLNYYCGTHGMGMGNHIVIPAIPPDPFDSDGEFFSVYRSHINVTAAAGTLYTGSSGTVYFMAVDENVPATNDSAFLTDSNINVAIDSDHQYGGGYGKVYNITSAAGSGTGLWYGNRAIFAGGNATNANPSNRIEYVDISLFNSNTTDFGDLQSSRNGITGASNGTIGVFIGGDEDAPTYVVDTIDKITTATTGNATDFGNTSDTMRYVGASCDGSRVVYGGGSYSPGVMKSNVMEYITIATPGNGTDFGDLTETIELSTFVNDATYSVRAGGQNNLSPNTTDVMDYVTIQTPSNATSFGTLSRSTWFGRNSASSTTRGLFAGGSQQVNNIDYITIATPGNSLDFGDLTATVTGTSAVSNNTRGLFSGGWSGGQINDMSYVTIATPGNATGGYTLADNVYNHGGLSGNAA